jgi:LPS O-antigen subunit length determinant protein (WzzB/FepE family)
LQSFAGSFTGSTPKLPDAQAVVDQYFDFAQQFLESQRSFTLSVLTVGTQAAENVTEQANRVAESVKSRTIQAGEDSSEQAGPAAAPATQAVRNTRPNRMRVSGHALRTRGCRAPVPSRGRLGGSYKAVR